MHPTNARSIHGEGGCGGTTTVRVGVDLSDADCCDEITGGGGIAGDATGGTTGAERLDEVDISEGAEVCDSALAWSFWYPNERRTGASLDVSVLAPGCASGSKSIFLTLQTGQIYSRDVTAIFFLSSVL